MRRNILIVLGLLTALLPYLGFPYDINKWVWTASGFITVVLLVVPFRVRKMHYQGDEQIGVGSMPRSLHVERKEVGDRAGIHIEREIITDTEHVEDSPTSDIIIEKQVTVSRRRKQKVSERIPASFEGMLKGDTQIE